MRRQRVVLGLLMAGIRPRCRESRHKFCDSGTSAAAGRRRPMRIRARLDPASVTSLSPAEQKCTMTRSRGAPRRGVPGLQRCFAVFLRSWAERWVKAGSDRTRQSEEV